MRGAWYRYSGRLDLLILILVVSFLSQMTKPQALIYARNDFTFVLPMGVVVAALLLTLAACTSVLAVTLRRSPLPAPQHEAFQIHFRLLSQAGLTTALVGLSWVVNLYANPVDANLFLFDVLMSALVVGLAQFCRMLAFLPKLWLGVPRLSTEIAE